MRSIVILINCVCLSIVTHAQDALMAFTPDKSIVAIGPYAEGLARAQTINNLFGYVDVTGRFAITPQFQKAGYFQDGMAVVGKEVNGQTRYGFINKTGKLVIPCTFNEVKDFSGGRAAVNSQGTWQYIDKQGKMKLNNTFIRVDTLTDRAYNNIKPNPNAFHNGLLLIRRANGYGYVDTSGNWRIPPGFLFAWDFSDGVAVVAAKTDKKEYSWTVIDTTGKILFTTSVETLLPFEDSIALFRKDGLWGYLDKKGNTVFPAQFSNKPFNMNRGITAVQIDGNAAGNKNGQIFLLSNTGRITAKVPLCNEDGLCINDSQLHFSDSLLAVKVGSSWGFLNTAGKMVIAPQYEQVSYFQDGRSAVITKDGTLQVLHSPAKK